MKKKQNKFYLAITSLAIGIAIAVGLTLASTMIQNVNEANADTNVFSYVGERTYRMLNPDNLKSGGTGFSVRAASGKTYTMTNAHVCSLSKENYMVAERNDRHIRLKIIDIAQNADLCLLEPVPNTESGIPLAGAVGLRERVFLVGHPLLQPLTLRTGFLAFRENIIVSYCSLARRIHKQEFLTTYLDESCDRMVDAQTATLDAMPGNSGSAVTNSSGDLVGVLFAANRVGLSLLVPLSTVREFLSIY